MKELPPLGSDATVRLSRQGGVTAMLSRPREIEFAQYNPDEREQICSLLKGCLPLTSSESGRGDQRFYQIEVRFRQDDRDDQLMLQVPEDRAPGELVRLWDKGLVS
ncbi:hypothetical protein HKK55_14135 [Pseudomonas sp. ADAK18]|uniref:protealysin inhibitor emfourin n=1 Tax=Pseudomonas sp. ADAK18 TaxID=2730848 RepID=UPI001463E69B|nr:protealysin inhibitor emfourin [Pseudomonas sp. ADAK18]QJI29804.1 hypothetical protein HKK55_14135 [Pseudomonas sp. ADAK18]